jgi:hypothetical protein
MNEQVLLKMIRQGVEKAASAGVIDGEALHTLRSMHWYRPVHVKRLENLGYEAGLSPRKKAAWQ